MEMETGVWRSEHGKVVSESSCWCHHPHIEWLPLCLEASKLAVYHRYNMLLAARIWTEILCIAEEQTCKSSLAVYSTRKRLNNKKTGKGRYGMIRLWYCANCDLKHHPKICQRCVSPFSIFFLHLRLRIAGSILKQMLIHASQAKAYLARHHSDGCISSDRIKANTGNHCPLANGQVAQTWCQKNRRIFWCLLWVAAAPVNTLAIDCNVWI